MSERDERKIVFAVGKGDDGIPTVILGVPREAWIYIKDGLTNHFDLTKAGIPVRLVVFGGKSHDSVMAEMQNMIGTMKIIDERDRDFGIDQKRDS